MILSLQLKHGTAKYSVQVDSGVSLLELMSEIEKVTGVPVSGQKLILTGKTLTSLDHSKTLTDCNITNNSKVMVLGKRYDPEADEMVVKVREIEAKSSKVSERLSEVAKETKDIEDGFLAKEHQKQALKALCRRCKGGSEEFMRLLETLDTLRFESHQSQIKDRRKSAVDQINKCLDHNDQLLSRIDKLLNEL